MIVDVKINGFDNFNFKPIILIIMKRIILNAFCMLSIVLFAAGCTGSGSSEERRSEVIVPDVQAVNRPHVAVLLTRDSRMPRLICLSVIWKTKIWILR